MPGPREVWFIWALAERRDLDDVVRDDTRWRCVESQLEMPQPRQPSESTVACHLGDVAARALDLERQFLEGGAEIRKPKDVVVQQRRSSPGHMCLEVKVLQLCAETRRERCGAVPTNDAEIGKARQIQ